MLFLMTSSITASFSVLYFTLSECCVEMTTESMRFGRSFSYSTVTWLLPSGRRKSTLPALRTAASCLVSLCAYMMGAGISSGVSSHA